MAGLKLQGLRPPTTRKGNLLTAKQFRLYARLDTEGANSLRGLLRESFVAYAH